MSDRDLNRALRTPEGAQEWLGMLQSLAEQIHKQQQNSQQMMDTYNMQLLNTPGSYLSGQADQQQQTLKQTLQQWMEQVQQQQQAFQQKAASQKERQGTDHRRSGRPLGK